MLSNIMTVALMATSAFALPSAAPASTKQASCMDVGVAYWTVENFDYRADYLSMKPKELTAVKAFVNFDLFNPVLGYKAKCSSLSESTPEPYASGKTWYQCKIDSKKAGADDKASFKYELKTRKLSIKQSWSCSKEGGRIDADGFVTVKNTGCTDTTTINNLWNNNGLYSNRANYCPKINVKTPIKNLVAIL